jgi:hypothetical protein
MQAVQHHVIDSPEINQSSHNGLGCFRIIYLNTMLPNCIHDVLTLLTADSAAPHLKLA